MKILNYLKVRKNRDLLIYINVAMSVGLALISVWMDTRFGTNATTNIYILQAICIINWVIAFPLFFWNIWEKSKKKLQKRNRKD